MAMIVKQSSPILHYKCWAWSWSWFLGSQPAGDLVINLVVGCSALLSTRPAVTFPTKEIAPLQWQHWWN